MAQEAAQLRLERALASKARLANEQLELQQGDLVDFYRQPATKDESGWRGPAEVVEAPGPPIVIRWQGRHLQVRTQDLRRALVYFVYTLPAFVNDDPQRSNATSVLVEFAEQLHKEVVRIGWVQSGGSPPTLSGGSPSTSWSFKSSRKGSSLGPGAFAGGKSGGKGGGGEPRELDADQLRAELGLPEPTAAQRKGEESDKIFVGGLPANCLEEEVLEYFVQYGEVIDVS